MVVGKDHRLHSCYEALHQGPSPKNLSLWINPSGWEDKIGPKE